MDISVAILATLGTVTFGGALTCLGLLLLGEYRNAFLRNPRAMMTLEVLSQMGGTTGPGYLAMFLLLVGGILMLIGIAGTILVLGTYVVDVLSLNGKQ